MAIPENSPRTLREQGIIQTTEAEPLVVNTGGFISLRNLSQSENNLESSIDFGYVYQSSKETTDRKIYYKNLVLIVRLVYSFLNQVFDIYLIATLFAEKKYMFASMFLISDLIPALPLLVEMYKKERSWKVIRFACHPINVVVWTFLTMQNEKYESTLNAMRTVHSLLEAPFQIILTITMISMGIIKWPEMTNKKFTNAYNATIDLHWWPIFTIIFSVISVFSETFKTQDQVCRETSKIVGFLTFVPLFFFRMLVLQLLIITTERFSLFMFCAMQILNWITLMYCQKEEIKYDPIIFGFLSIILPARPVIASSDNQPESLPVHLLFALVSTGNVLFLTTYSIIFGLYTFDVYNPWCNEDLSNILFEEELFGKTFAFFFTLFLAATVPTFFVYIGWKKRLPFSKKSRFKDGLIGGTALILFSMSVFILCKELKKVQYVDSIISIRSNSSNSINYTDPSWSQWYPSGDGINLSRVRVCRDVTLLQNKLNSTNFGVDHPGENDNNKKIEANQTSKLTNETKTTSSWNRSSTYFHNGDVITESSFDVITETIKKPSSNQSPGQNSFKAPMQLKIAKSYTNSLTYDKILIVGGSTTTVEVIDLSSNRTKCENLPKFPVQISQQAGSLLDGQVPIVCGGRTSNKHYFKECYIFKNGIWSKYFSLNEARLATAIAKVQIPGKPFQLMVAGGAYSSQGCLGTIEVLSTSGWQLLQSQQLALKVCSHCALQINATTVLVIGGIHNRTFYSETFYYEFETESWSQGPELKYHRYGHSCAMIRKDLEIEEKSVIVIGGSSHSNKLPHVEVLDNKGAAWRQGPKLPFGVDSAPLIEDPDGGVILVGGWRKKENKESYEMEQHLWKLQNAGKKSVWKKMGQKVQVQREDYSAILVPSDITNCK